MGLDVDKRSVYVTEMEENGEVKDRYEIKNDDESWDMFRERYP